MKRYWEMFCFAPEGTSAAGAASTGDSTGAGTGQSPTPAATLVEVKFTAEQQAHLDKVIAERLQRAKSSWEEAAQKAQAKAAEEAQARKLAEQNEFQKLAEQRQTQLTALEQQLQTKEQLVQRYLLQNAFRLTADALKAQFASTQAEQDAFALLDQSNVKVEDGKVTGMDAALKALQTQRPYLFAPVSMPGTANINAANGRGAPNPATPQAREEDLRKRFGLHI